MRLFVLAMAAIGVLWAQDPLKVAGDHYHLAFENQWARAYRVTYGPHESAPLHDHPNASAALYVYVTDAGPLVFRHDKARPGVAGMSIQRKAVQAGRIRVTHPHPETHATEYLGDQPMEYARIELLTELPSAPRDAVIAPAVIDPSHTVMRQEYEDEQMRILRVVCAAGHACPQSAHPDDPAIVVTMNGPRKGEIRWKPAGDVGPVEQVRVELKSGRGSEYPLRYD